jgi:hypothetical protein
MEAKNNDQGISSGPPTVEPHQYFSSEGSPDAEITDIPDRVKLENNNTSYTNSSHWTSILDGVTCRPTIFEIKMC